MNSETETPATPMAPPPNSSASQRRWRWWTGALAGLLLAAIVGAPLLYLAYRKGKERGREVERERLFLSEQYFVPPHRQFPQEPLEIAPHKLEPARQDAGGPVVAASPLAVLDPAVAREDAAELITAPAPEAWCFTANECVRDVWPMEILPKSSSVDHPHFRFREGANRLTGLDNGLCEFVFRTDRTASVAVYLHARFADQCGDSLRCYMDGGAPTVIGGMKVFGRWIWVHSMRQFRLYAGLHRLTLQTREDSLEFDRVVVANRPLFSAELDGLPATQPPVFESLPPAAPNLPAIGAVTAQMLASDSLVIGAGHRNTLTVFLRLNGREAVAGQVELQSFRAGYSEQREFRLTPEQRTHLLSWEITLRPQPGYFAPLQMRVELPSGCLQPQALNFIRPLAWAFLGPIPDPEGKGLDFVPRPEQQIATFPLLPKFPGLEWKTVEDGSCYNEFGVVDLNKVFGRPDEGWREGVKDRPEIAYAVTVVAMGANRHMPLVMAGDDCVQAWMNGKLLIRQPGNAPLETSRLVVGTDVMGGPTSFIFKVPQTRCYWQLLFEPETTLPYSYPYAFQPLPIYMLKWFSGSRNSGPPR